MALDTSATMSGEDDSDVISQAAVLSLIHDAVSAVNEASHNERKLRCRSGSHAFMFEAIDLSPNPARDTG